VAYDSPTLPAKVTAEFSMTVNSGIFIDTSGSCRAIGPLLSTVSGASFRSGAVAAEGIATLFGSGLATTFASATALPLPMDIAGTRVTMTDAAGVSRGASFFYVSPDQVNVYVPSGMRAGTAQVVVTRADNGTSRGAFEVAAVSPDVFSANSNGQGVAAATAVRVNTDGTTTPVPVFQCGAEQQTCVPDAISVQSGSVYLSLYATGVRAAANVRVTVGGTSVPVLYAGRQPQYVVLDQINVLLPESLRGRGTTSVAVEADGVVSNAVTVNIQ
jgi:uncharacterized protein (TIGR03437 family)